MKARMHRTAIAAAVMLVAATLGAAAPDVTKLGPQVGERVPDFTLTDQKGVTRSLGSLLGPGGLMLVFYRSADW